MSLYRRAIALALAAAALCTSAVGCIHGDDSGATDGASDAEASSDDSSGSDGASDDGSTDDGAGDDSVVQDAPSDNGLDAASPDVAPIEASRADSAKDSAPPTDGSGSFPDGAPDATLGTLVITADASLETTVLGGACAAANSLVAAPNETSIGKTIALTASGIDPANQSADVTLTWSATGTAGSLAATTGTTNTFTCASAGTALVTVTAAISEGGASCPATGSLMATLTCSAP